MKTFNSIHSKPPGGYFYQEGDDIVRSQNRIEIARMAKELRVKHGLPVRGDCFQFVMDHMCPHLPDGFCNSPSTHKYKSPADIKVNTLGVFNQPVEPVDVIQERLEKCFVCPRHSTHGVCPTCTGLVDWVVAGFKGRRPPIPHDVACGVCKEDMMLVAATASVAPFAPVEGASYPNNCWRKETLHAETR